MFEITAAARAEWRLQWPLVLAACFGFAFLSLMNSSLGLFMGPLEEEFGWSRAQLSIGFTIAGILTIPVTPFLGLAIDRWGTRRLALPGLALTAFATAGFAFSNGSFALWAGWWLLWGACTLLITALVWTAAVAGVFSAGRGLALGVLMSGTAAAQVIAPPLVNGLIENFGWRAAFVWLGLGWGTIAFLLALLFLYDAHDQRRRSGTGPETAGDSMSGLALAEAWRDSSLWRIAASTFLIMAVTLAVLTHQFPILVEAGASRGQAAWLVSLFGVAGIVGKLVTGALIDRFHGRWVGGLTLASTALAYPLMIETLASIPLLIVGIMISGYAAGTKMQLCGYLTSRYAGMRNYGTIFGVMASVIALAAALGPLIAGWSHDRYGSYTPLLVFGVAASLVSGLLMFTLGRYPDSGDRQPDPAAVATAQPV